MKGLKQIGSHKDGSPIMARQYVTKAVAAKWIEEGRARCDGITRTPLGQAFGVLTVFAGTDRPGYTCHYRDPAYDGQGIISSVAADFGRRGGQSRSEAKAAAARLNGRKGGRPRKKQPDSRRKSSSIRILILAFMVLPWAPLLF